MPVEVNQKDLLTPKQQEIAALVAKGLRNKEIAASMGHTLHMMKNYVEAIFVKLGFNSRLELALWWVKHMEGR